MLADGRSGEEAAVGCSAGDGLEERPVGDAAGCSADDAADRCSDGAPAAAPSPCDFVAGRSACPADGASLGDGEPAECVADEVFDVRPLCDAADDRSPDVVAGRCSDDVPPAERPDDETSDPRSNTDEPTERSADDDRCPDGDADVAARSADEVFDARPFGDAADDCSPDVVAGRCSGELAVDDRPSREVLVVGRPDDGWAADLSFPDVDCPFDERVFGSAVVGTAALLPPVKPEPSSRPRLSVTGVVVTGAVVCGEFAVRVVESGVAEVRVAEVGVAEVELVVLPVAVLVPDDVEVLDEDAVPDEVVAGGTVVVLGVVSDVGSGVAVSRPAGDGTGTELSGRTVNGSMLRMFTFGRPPPPGSKAPNMPSVRLPPELPVATLVSGLLATAAAIWKPVFVSVPITAFRPRDEWEKAEPAALPSTPAKPSPRPLSAPPMAPPIAEPLRDSLSKPSRFPAAIWPPWMPASRPTMNAVPMAVLVTTLMAICFRI